jgi:hypothetical protein
MTGNRQLTRIVLQFELLERITLQRDHCFRNAASIRAAAIAVESVTQAIAPVSVTRRSQDCKRANIVRPFDDGPKGRAPPARDRRHSLASHSLVP